MLFRFPVEDRLQLVELFRVVGSNVISLTEILTQVVKFPLVQGKVLGARRIPGFFMNAEAIHPSW